MQIKLASHLTYDSIVDGPGMRIVVWTQGCSHNCFQCHNPQTHDYNGGSFYDIDKIVEDINNYKLKSGVTISGGEPFDQPEALLELVLKLKKHKINIWIYSGYTFEKLLTSPKTRPILDYIDVLVDGRFDYLLKDFFLKFRGSSNQRIINVCKTLEFGEINLWEGK